MMTMKTAAHEKIILVKVKDVMGGQGLVPPSPYFIMQEQKQRCPGSGRISRQYLTPYQCVMPMPSL